MPKKGMRSLFSVFNSSNHGRPSLPPPPSPPKQTFSATMMEDNISTAEFIITKWDPDYSSYAKITSLFYESRAEAKQFLRAVSDLQTAMLFFVSDGNPVSRTQTLIRAQTLMQTAMRRLEKEFYQILAANRDRLDPESVSLRSSVSDPDDDAGSVDDEIRVVGEFIGEVELASTIAMSDLRSIADTMIISGYGKECIKIYKLIRKSIVNESLYRLGFEQPTPSQIQKLDWEVLDLKIRSWLSASKVAVKTLFSGERILCDTVFHGSDSIRESCFSDITKDAAVHFLRFPELVAKLKRSPEKMFRILDLYDAVSDLWQEIETVFSFESTSIVRSQALASLLKLAEAARGTMAEFEVAIQKDASKSLVPGGGIHPLTRYVMNYIGFLADYDGTLADIFADFPFQMQSPLPECFLDTLAASPSASPYASPSASPSSFEESPQSSMSVRFAWMVLVLLCKLDGKAENYREVALSYLFLANNLQYMVNKVRSSKLRVLLGDEWVFRHEAKARQYAAKYERLWWGKVAAAIPSAAAADEMSAVEMREKMRGFNVTFEVAWSGHGEWLVTEERMREEVRASIARSIVPAYREFYERCRVVLREEENNSVVPVVRYAPEDVEKRLSDLFSGSSGSGSVSVSGSGWSRISSLSG